MAMGSLLLLLLGAVPDEPGPNRIYLYAVTIFFLMTDSAIPSVPATVRVQV
jgi:hypothetical protein